MVHDVPSQWIQSGPCRNKTSQDTMNSVQRFLPPGSEPGVFYTDNYSLSMEFTIACEELSWTHDKSTPHRSATKGIDERVARRVK